MTATGEQRDWVLLLETYLSIPCQISAETLAILGTSPPIKAEIASSPHIPSMSGTVLIPTA